MGPCRSSPQGGRSAEGGSILSSVGATMELRLRPFQRRFVADVLAPGVRTTALSLPRGNGKSSLVASLAARTLRPDDPLHVAGVENHIVAASIGQARRTVFKLLREALDDDDKTYKFAEKPYLVSRVPSEDESARLRAGERRIDRAGARSLPVGIR